jgi:hypothetical protein
VKLPLHSCWFQRKYLGSYVVMSGQIFLPHVSLLLQGNSQSK